MDYVQKYSGIMALLINGYASELKRTTGIDWVAVPEGAPEDWQGVRNEWLRCLHLRHTFYTPPFRVWSGGSDKSIWGAPEFNHAFRYVHDVTAHCIAGLSFSDEDEILSGQMFAVAMYIRALTAGYSEEQARMVRRLSLIDTAGQILYKQHMGEFPKDQAGFANAVINGRDNPYVTPDSIVGKLRAVDSFF